MTWHRMAGSCGSVCKWLVLLAAASACLAADAHAKLPPGRYLYVACPGVRNYLEYGGHGLLVFDVDGGHKFVKRIRTAGLDLKDRPINVKGVCASAQSGRLYISTLKQLMCLDLASEEILWERKYHAGCDRMSMTPDGKTIYLPSLEGSLWYVINADDGDVIRTVEPDSGAHNTICGPSGRFAYLAGLRSPLLSVVDTHSGVVKTVGPFSASVRPFTVDGRERYCYVNVNDLLGFEIGDLRNGPKLHRVEVAGFAKGPVKRHGCPSHGIGMTPDGKEIWVCDAANARLHIFDATVMPPVQIASVPVRDEPGWVTFSIDGAYAYPSTGDVIDTKTRKVVAALTDETGAAVQSEKMIAVHWDETGVSQVGNQFGIGRGPRDD